MKKAIILFREEHSPRTLVKRVDFISAPGMSDKNIFRPGFSTKEQGWGLGLSLTSRIIKDIHGGDIYVSKSKPGKGSTIEIALPKLEDAN